MKNANPVSLLAALLLAVLAVGAPAGCAKEKAAAAPAARKTAADFFPIKVGERTVRMQLAVRPEEMQRGLMERRDLGRDDGMIFVYERPQQLAFWMRNTPTPLDIGYFDAAGALAEVHQLHPFDERTVASRGQELQFALETNQGWYRAAGVAPGARLDLKGLAAALRERGFEPARFGL